MNPIPEIRITPVENGCVVFVSSPTTHDRREYVATDASQLLDIVSMLLRGPRSSSEPVQDE